MLLFHHIEFLSFTRCYRYKSRGWRGQLTFCEGRKDCDAAAAQWKMFSTQKHSDLRNLDKTLNVSFIPFTTKQKNGSTESILQMHIAQ